MQYIKHTVSFSMILFLSDEISAHFLHYRMIWTDFRPPILAKDITFVSP